MSELTLFDMGTVPAPEPGQKLSDGRRRTIRQEQALARGSHPLALLGSPLRLHPEAPSPDDRKAPGPRCGGCLFITRNAWGYPKCTRGRSGEIGTPSFRSGPFETHGDATTIRAWWPGCESWVADGGAR